MFDYIFRPMRQLNCRGLKLHLTLLLLFLMGICGCLNPDNDGVAGGTDTETTVVGIVYSPEKYKVQGARVSLYEKVEEEIFFLREMYSDTDGRYAFHPLDSGRYSVLIRYISSGQKYALYSNNVIVDATKSLVVVPDSVVRSAIQISGEVQIVGELMDTVELNFSIIDLPQRDSVDMAPGDSGKQFLLDYIPAGDYTFVADDPSTKDSVEITRSITVDAGSEDIIIPITVGEYIDTILPSSSFSSSEEFSSSVFDMESSSSILSSSEALSSAGDTLSSISLSSSSLLSSSLALSSSSSIPLDTMSSSPGESSSSSVLETMDSTFRVQPVYLYPQDLEYHVEYEEAIDSTMKEIQQWFLDKVGHTFHLKPLQVKQHYSNYLEMRCGSAPTQACIDSVMDFYSWGTSLSQDTMHWEEKTVTLVFAQGGGGWATSKIYGKYQGLGLLGDWVLEPVSGFRDTMANHCGFATWQCEGNVPKGTVAWALANAFGLKKPIGEDKNTITDWHGDYPEVGFLAYEVFTLQNHPAFVPGSWEDHGFQLNYTYIEWDHTRTDTLKLQGDHLSDITYLSFQNHIDTVNQVEIYKDSNWVHGVVPPAASSGIIRACNQKGQCSNAISFQVK